MAFLGFILRLSPLERAKSQSPLRKLRRPFFGLLLFILSFNACGPVHAQESKEYQLKAAFLFNFAQFVKWPSDSFASADAPFCIGILGDDPFGAALEDTIQGETINSHKLRVMHGHSFDDLKDCQLIFICKSEGDRMSEILSQLDSKPILTVSDIESFAQNGGIIDFYLQGGRVRFEINPDSAQRRGLKISSQLLTLGKIVGGGN
jgi:YfiR/HmsC-like